MELNEIKALLADMNLKAVAEGAGVDYQKLLRFSRGDVAEPSYTLVKRVSDYLEARAQKVA
jgi:hypothetical protein